MSDNKNRVKIEIAIDERGFARAEKLAKSLGMSVEQLLEQAVKDTIKREHNED